MAETQKIKIKLGSNEFEAEGPVDLVKAQLSEFLEIIKSAGTAQLGASPAPIPPSPVGAEDGLKGPQAELVDRIFKQERDGLVSLKVLPKGKDRDADTLLLLLYGYKRLKNQENILGTRLMKAATRSGLQIKRIDRTFTPHESLIVKGGYRRGKTYTLNNQGVIKAEEMLPKVFET
jgi:hypothetical protein